MDEVDVFVLDSNFGGGAEELVFFPRQASYAQEKAFQHILEQMNQPYGHDVTMILSHWFNICTVLGEGADQCSHCIIPRGLAPRRGRHTLRKGVP